MDDSLPGTCVFIGEFMRPNQRRGWLRKRIDKDGGSDPLWDVVPRLIEASVGKNWNETFSMICRRWHKDSKEGHRVRYIVKQTVLSEVSYWRSSTLVVDEDGILVRREWNWSWNFPKTEVTKITIKNEPRDTRFYEKIDGFWYEIHYARSYHDEFLPGDVIEGPYYKHQYYTLVETYKRRMSNREVDEKVLKTRQPTRHHREGSSAARFMKSSRRHPKVHQSKERLVEIRSELPPIPRWIQPTIWGTPR